MNVRRSAKPPAILSNLFILASGVETAFEVFDHANSRPPTSANEPDRFPSIARRADGSIDMAFYIDRGRAERALCYRQVTARIGPALRRVLRAGRVHWALAASGHWSKHRSRQR